MLCLIFVVISAAFPELHATQFKDLIEMVNTTDKTWVYSSTTNRTDYECAYCTKPGLDCTQHHCFYEYEYHYSTRSAQTQETREAILMDQCPKHVKTPCILRRKGKQRIMKLLMYYHRDHHCAVYKVIGLTGRNEGGFLQGMTQRSLLS
uniref:Lipocalin n=1 Tax=Rhipicephalus zambeziensis TaxID=60191 RepID=A0A224YLX4_9ACAR